MTMAFDTLRYAQRLQQVGVAREQAETHAELARDMVIADLATKADLAAAVRELQAEMKVLEQRMTIKLGAMIAAAVAIVVAAQKLF
jgi:hypothetical protein